MFVQACNFNSRVVKGRRSGFEASMGYLEKFHIQKKEGREGDTERRIKFSLGWRGECGAWRV